MPLSLLPSISIGFFHPALLERRRCPSSQPYDDDDDDLRTETWQIMLWDLLKR